MKQILLLQLGLYQQARQASWLWMRALLVFVSMTSFGRPFTAATMASGDVPPSITWQKVFGGSSGDEALAVAATKDGGYVAVGRTTSTDGDGSGYHGGEFGDFFIVKTNASGNLLWKKILGGSGDDYAFAVTATADGGCVVAGLTNSSDGDVSGIGKGAWDFWVVKLTVTGDIAWQKVLGGGRNEAAFGITNSADGGVVVAGYTRSSDGDVTNNHGYRDLWVVKLSSTGDLVWQKAIGGPGFEQANAITATADGGYIVVGQTAIADDAEENVYVVKLNGTGDVVWQKTAGGSGRFERANAVVASADGGCIVAGITTSNDGDVSGYHGNGDAWVFKLNNSGDLIWQKALGGSERDEASSVLAMAEGGYLLVGTTSSADGDVTNSQGGDAWVVKLSDTGALVWQKTYGGSGGDGARSVAPTNDGYVLAGASDSFNDALSNNHGGGDFWLAKLAGSTPFTLLPPRFDCTAPGYLHMVTTGGDGSPVEFSGIGITDWTTEASHQLEAGVLSDLNTKSLTLKARQNGQVAEYTFNFRDHCAYPRSMTAFVGQSVSETPGWLLLESAREIMMEAVGLPSGIYLDIVPVGQPGSGQSYWRFNGAPTTSAGSPFDVTVNYFLRNAPSKRSSYSFRVTVLDPAPLTLLAPTFDCQTGAIIFQTSGGNGTPIEFGGIGITDWSTNPNQQVEAEVLKDPNTTTLTLKARQSGRVVDFPFHFRAFCSGVVSRTAYVGQDIATTTGWGLLGRSDQESASATGLPPGLRLEVVPIQFGGPEGGGLYWVFAGVPTTATGSPFRATLTRTRNGQTTTTTLLITVIQLPLMFQPPLYSCLTGELTINYKGGNGTPVQFMVPGLGDWQNFPSFTVPSWIRNDPNAQPLQLMLRQSGQVVTYPFNFRVQCTTARVIVSEANTSLQINVLGNPVNREIVAEVSGAVGRPLRIQLTDVAGRVLAEQQLNSVQATERIHIPLTARPTELLLLHASTPTQHQTVRVLMN